MDVNHLKQFTRIHTNSLIKTEKTLKRPVTIFYNGGNVNVIAAESQRTKTRSTSFNKKEPFIRNNANRYNQSFEN